MARREGPAASAVTSPQRQPRSALVSPADELLAELHAAVARHDVGLFEAGTSPVHEALGTIDGIEQALVSAGARRALARLLASDAMADVATWMRAADAAGVDRKRIARLAACSRQTVYDNLD